MTTEEPPPLEELLAEQRPTLATLSPRDRGILEICSTWIDAGVRIDGLLSPGGLKNLEGSVVFMGHASGDVETAVQRFRDLGWLHRLVELRTERVSRKCDLCFQTPWVRSHQVRPETRRDANGNEYVHEGPERVCATCARLIDGNKRKKLAKHRVNAIGPVRGIRGVMPAMPRKVALAISLAVVDKFFERRLD